MLHDPIDILRYATAPLPLEERYSDWLARSWPRADAIYRTEPLEPFDTLFESAELGDITFVHAKISAMRWERRLHDIRASDFDPLIVNMMIRGSAKGDFDGRAFHEDAGAFHFQDLARPSRHVSTTSRTFSLVVPRPLAAARFGRLDDLHGLVVTGASADLLLGHAERVWKALPGLDRSSAPALGGSLLDLLVAAATHARRTAAPTAKPDTGLRRRAGAMIESRLNTALNVAELCGALGVSRRSLFAAFAADGGVYAYIRTKRLERARAALADLERREPIGTIAGRLGFCDASHLSRLFRTRYGMTPRDYRELVANDGVAQPQASASSGG